MKVIKNFKFVSNLEYVHAVLSEQNIPHSVDLENLSISSDELERKRILQIIEDLKLDENEVEIDPYILEGYEEWDKNMYNSGYYTGGKIPTFLNDTNNYLMYGYLTLISGTAGLIEILNSKKFNRNAFWISVVVIITISASLFYQYYKFKKQQKSK